MRNLATLGAALLFAPFFEALPSVLADSKPKPLWRIDLHTYQRDHTDEIAVRFSDRFLVIYLSQEPERLVYDIDTHERVPEQALASMTVPPREEPGLTRFKKPYPEVNIIARWKQMAIEQIGGVGLRDVGDAEYYLQEPGRDKILLYRAHCTNRGPTFAGDDYILFHLCNGKNVVVNKRGQRVYDLPTFSDPYVFPNRKGDRFVVYDRGVSLFGQFEGTDRLRVTVFRSSDGKKLFESHWHPAPNEGTGYGRAALSDDGFLVAIVKAGEILVYAVPPGKQGD